MPGVVASIGRKMAEPLGPGTFHLAKYLCQHEMTVKHLLSMSDAETMKMSDLLEMADEECLDLWKNLKLGPTYVLGHPVLRKEISKLYQTITTDDILVIAAQEGIFIAMRALVNYCRVKFGDTAPKAVTIFPAFQSLYENLKTMGCQVDHWKPNWSAEDGWKFDLSDLQKLLTPDTRILVVNFPHNPTGFTPTPTQWNELINMCKEHNLLLFSDEIYRCSNTDGSSPLPPACDEYEKAITLFGLSKSLGMLGLRIGWVCTHDKFLMEDMVSFNDYITICSSAPSEVLSIIALRNKDKIMARNVEIMQSNLDKLDVFFDKYQDLFIWKRPPVGVTTLVGMTPKALKLFGSVQQFADRLRHESQILLLPSSKYEMEDTHFRIGFGRANMAEGLGEFGKFLDKCLEN